MSHLQRDIRVIRKVTRLIRKEPADVQRRVLAYVNSLEPMEPPPPRPPPSPPALEEEAQNELKTAPESHPFDAFG